MSLLSRRGAQLSHQHFYVHTKMPIKFGLPRPQHSIVLQESERKGHDRAEGTVLTCAEASRQEQEK